MAQKEQLVEKSRLEQELRSALGKKSIWESAEEPTRTPPPASNLPRLCDGEEKMEAADTPRIAEALAQHAAVVDNKAYVARNLAGMSKRRLRMAALAVRAGARILSKSAQHSVAFNETRMEALLAKVKRL